MSINNLFSKFLLVLLAFSLGFNALAQNTPGTPVADSAVSDEIRVLFSSAQELHPELFTGGTGWFLHDGYTYKYFADSHAYVGVKEGRIYVMGGTFGNFAQLGTVTDIAAELQFLKHYVVQNVPHGTVVVKTYHSTALDRDRQFYVYTPPGYSASGAPYPVLYLLHGAGSTETSWTERGLVNVIMDNMLAAGTIQPFVVVMPYGYAYPPGPNDRTDPVKLKEQRSGFNADFLQDVIPLAEASYNISSEQSGRAIAGLSLGGAQSLALGLGHPELFSRVAAFSPAMGATNSPATGGVDYDLVLADTTKLNRSLQYMWLSSGVDDTLFTSIQAFDDQLSKHGIEHIFRVTQGAHTWEVWKRNFFEVAPQLFAPERF